MQSESMGCQEMFLGEKELDMAQKFLRVNKRHPCPICGGISFCSYNDSIAVCTRIEEGSIKACKPGKMNIPQWIHRIESGQVDYTSPQKNHEGCVIAEPAQRDRVYRAFLSLLSLEHQHLENLSERGFSILDTEMNMYRSVPLKGRWRIAETLIKQGHSLIGIPGFYQKVGQNGQPYWTFKGPLGVFIPAKNEQGLIVGLRIRLDNPEVNEKGKIKNKYLWFSSLGEYLGTGSGAPLHFEMGRTDLYWITEGEFKAHMIRKVSEHSVISVPGVEAWMDVASYLLKKGIKRVIIAFDMDKHENERVMAALNNLIFTLKAGGVQVATAEWDLRLAKGLDDLIKLGEKPRYEMAS